MLNSIMASLPKPLGSQPPYRLIRIREQDSSWSGLAQLFKLLADETRLNILAALFGKGEMNVSALCRILCVKQPALSHHLAFLRMAGIVGSRRAGKHNFYRFESGLAFDLLEPYFAAAEEGIFPDTEQKLIPAYCRK